MAMSETERQQAVTVYPAGYEFEEEIDEKLQEEKTEFDKFKEEIHDANDYAKISVSKKQTDSSGRPIGKAVFDCFECGIEDYTFTQLCERIRSDFGTGLYLIIGRDSAGKYKFRKTVGVAAPKTAGDETEGAGNIGGLINTFSDALQKQQERTEQLLRNAGLGVSAKDPLEQMTAMMGAMGAMMGHMGISPQQPVAQKTMLEQMQEFALMKELMSDLGGGSSSDSIYGLLTETVKNIGPLLTLGLAAGKKDGSVNDAGIIQPEMPALPEPTEEQTAVNSNKELESMRPQLEFLLMQAKGGADPGDVSAFVIKQIPDDSLENVEAFLAQENVIDLCIGLIPEIAEHKTWFVDWQTITLAQIAQVFDTGEDSAGGDDDDEPSDPEKTLTGDGKGNIKGKETGAGDSTDSKDIAPDPSTKKPSDT